MPSTSNVRRVDFALRLVCRFVLVVAFVAYAMAKLAGAQYITAGGMLDKPVADLSGNELAFVYLGYSPLYGYFVAIGELLAAALLAFDRTARFGAVILLPIVTNVFVLNLGINFGAGTLGVSLLLLALNVYLLAGEFPLWKKIFWDDTRADPTRPLLLRGWASGIARIVSFVILAGGTFWLFRTVVAEARNTPLAGDWKVVSATIDGQRAKALALGGGWRWICFDSFGRLSVRTNRYTFYGKYASASSADGFTLSFDPEPVPPVYPNQSISELGLSPTEEKRAFGESYADYQWPIVLNGTFTRAREDLILVTIYQGKRIELVLSPYSRPKW